MADAFEDAKKEIRSLLITFQNGTSLSEFKKEYRKVIGRRIPYQELNFRDEISLLMAMNDAVCVRPSPVRGDYHLFGIADKSVKHIQKMVCKQKPSKHRVSYRPPRRSPPPSCAPPRQRNYILPPRFNRRELPNGVDNHVVRMLENYPNGLKIGQFLNEFCNAYKRQFTFRDWGFSTLEECLETIPGITATTRNNEILIHLTKFVIPKESSYHFSQASDFNFKSQSSSKPPPLLSQSNAQVSDSHFKSQSSSKRSPLLPLPNTQESDSYFERESSSKRSPLLPLPQGAANIKLQSSNVDVCSPSNTNVDYFDRNFKSTSFTNTQDTVSTLKNKEYASSNYLLDRCVEESYKQSLQFQNSIDVSASQSSSIKDNVNPAHDQAAAVQSNSKADTLDTFQLVDLSTASEPNTKSSNAFNYQNLNTSNYQSAGLLDTFNCEPFVSEVIKGNLRKVIEKFPNGIYAIQFTKYYEQVTNTSFNLHNLGFNYLADFIDAVPDIMVRKSLAGSKKDWVIFPAKVCEDFLQEEIGDGKSSALYLETAIINIRKILQAFEEGIFVTEFINVYSHNCREVLYYQDLGFDNIENFLLSIAERVPLKIVSVETQKIVMIDTFAQKHEPIKPPVAPLQMDVPPRVALPGSKFKELELPRDFDFTKYIPVYTSSIAHPGLLFIQLQGEEYSDALKSLYDEIDDFYRDESQSKSYQMKLNDIKVDAPCVALWPSDNHWYRASIVSLESSNFVQVVYVDYHTADQIPIHMLRYIKEEYMELPKQALKARLAYLRPARKAPKWDNMCRQRMLELCSDVPLMAKIEHITDNILSLILCNTNGEDDLFINDILVSEQLAENEDDGIPITEPQPQPEIVQKLFTYIAANLKTTPNDLAMALQNVSLPKMSPPGFGPQPVAMHAISSPQETVNNLYANSYNPFAPSIPIAAPSYPLSVPVASSNQIDSMISAPSIPAPVLTGHSSLSCSPEESDIFNDDDDMFELMCQQYLPETKDKKQRYVKRIMTSDGYIFHVLIHQSKPYASSGDISTLIWKMKSPLYLIERLSNRDSKDIVLPSVTLTEEGNEEFFQQLERFSVKGIQKHSDKQSSCLMYPLECVNQILNLFGQPSASLRAKIETEYSNFNPSSPQWQMLSDDEVIEEREDDRRLTDDDKKSNNFNNLCISDLQTMKNSIKMKRLELLKKQTSNPSLELDEEISNLNKLFSQVRDRMAEIEHICKLFKK